MHSGGLRASLSTRVRWLLSLALLLAPTALCAQPSLALTKTVGTDPTSCAATTNLTVSAGTTVYYCYEVVNTGSETLSVHDLSDSELGAILSGFAFDLTPGASLDTVVAGLTVAATIGSDTTNTATWTGTVTGGSSVQGTATATVFVDGAPIPSPTAIPAVSGWGLALLALATAAAGVSWFGRQRAA